MVAERRRSRSEGKGARVFCCCWALCFWYGHRGGRKIRLPKEERKKVIWGFILQYPSKFADRGMEIVLFFFFGSNHQAWPDYLMQGLDGCSDPKIVTEANKETNTQLNNINLSILLAHLWTRSKLKPMDEHIKSKLRHRESLERGLPEMDGTSGSENDHKANLSVEVRLRFILFPSVRFCPRDSISFRCPAMVPDWLDQWPVRLKIEIFFGFCAHNLMKFYILVRAFI